MTARLPGARTVDVSGLAAAIGRIAPAMEAFTANLRRAVVSIGPVTDRLRYEMLVTNLMRAQTYAEARALANLRRAREIRDGRLRHRRVKYRRDQLRAARKQAALSYP